MKPIRIFFVMTGIYKVTSPTDRVYIGQSVYIENRFKEYKKLKCKGQIRLYNSFKKHGVENHKFEVIEECVIDKLNERERHWQDYYNVLSKGGLNCFLTKTNDISGRKSYETIYKTSMTKYGRPPLEKKERVRFNMIGENNPFFGKKHSEESKRKMSESSKGDKSCMFGKKGQLCHNYGRRHSDEVNAKKGRKGELNHWYGKSMSEDVKNKIRESKKGKQTMGDNPNSKKVIDKSNGMIFYSLKELSIFTDISYDILRRRVKNKEYRYNYLSRDFN